ncbi:uncharacterized protein C8A04DRAFT_25505 [Dichotomopilus funicola]|uniref:Uncharacterized protein n=1 Tax=Dichotomopilus funicola TaxID=1934379 RepID=A0AAN6ZQS2_9PEZI|nr:hypothetical protein C8A04DRAFT_25505 [Dichotomopilus funicola]
MASMLVYSEVKRLYTSLQEIMGRRRKRQLQISDPFDFKKEVTIIPGLTEDEITVLREKAAASRLGIAHAHSNPQFSTHHRHHHHHHPHHHHPHHSHHSLPSRVRSRRFTTATTVPTSSSPSLATPNYFFHTQSHDDIALLPRTTGINTGINITIDSGSNNNTLGSPRSPQSPDSQLSPLTILPLSSLSAPPTPAPPSIFSAPRSPPLSGGFVCSPPPSPAPVVITLSGTSAMGDVMGGGGGNGNGNGDEDEDGAEGRYGQVAGGWGIEGISHSHSTGNGFLAVPPLSPPPLSPPPRVSMPMGFPAASSSRSPSPSPSPSPPPPVPWTGSTGEHGRRYAFCGSGITSGGGTGLRPPTPPKRNSEMVVNTAYNPHTSHQCEGNDETDPLIPGVDMSTGLKGGCVSTSPMGGRKGGGGGGREGGLDVPPFEVSPVEAGDYGGVGDWERGAGFDAGSPVSTLSCIGVN